VKAGDENMSISEVIYLGPSGTYAYEVALKRFSGIVKRFRACESIREICQDVAASRSSRGIVPIVNSSGGMIYETIDNLLDDNLALCIEEEIALNVRLALLGRKGGTIGAIYSHFVPFKHCGDYLKKTYPAAKWVEVGSTAIAAREASNRNDGAAIGNRRAASIYGLDILRFPIPGLSSRNVTHFFVIGSKCTMALNRKAKTSLAVRLANKPGALFHFLKPLAERGLNLSRLISRPIPGQPKESAFFMDIDENYRKTCMKDALSEARLYTDGMRILGSYPSFRSYTSS